MEIEKSLKPAFFSCLNKPDNPRIGGESKHKNKAKISAKIITVGIKARNPYQPIYEL